MKDCKVKGSDPARLSRILGNSSGGRVSSGVSADPGYASGGSVPSDGGDTFARGGRAKKHKGRKHPKIAIHIHAGGNDKEAEAKGMKKGALLAGMMAGKGGGLPPDMGGGMPPPEMMGPPPGGGGGMPMPPPDMPMPPPGAGPAPMGGMPPPPMARHGGRFAKGGKVPYEGEAQREEAKEQASGKEKTPHDEPYKRGGKVMAGAGSGIGRLQKAHSATVGTRKGPKN